MTVGMRKVWWKTMFPWISTIFYVGWVWRSPRKITDLDRKIVVKIPIVWRSPSVRKITCLQHEKLRIFRENFQTEFSERIFRENFLPYFPESCPPQNPVYTRENSCTFVPFSIESAFMVTIHPQHSSHFQLHIDIHITSPCHAIWMNRWSKLLESKRVDVVALVKCTNVVGNHWQ